MLYDGSLTWTSKLHYENMRFRVCGHISSQDKFYWWLHSTVTIVESEQTTDSIKQRFTAYNQREVNRAMARNTTVSRGRLWR